MGKVVIIGGGVIGLFSAYYLSEKGHQVVIVDKGDFTQGCSFGNAGMIVPSHVIPLAAPGMISKGVRWMFDQKSPFYVKPKLNRELLSWGLKFYRSANENHIQNSKTALRDLSLLSKSLYQKIAEKTDQFQYEEKGLLMLYRTISVGQEEIEAGKIAQDLGLEVDFLHQNQLNDLDYGIATSAIGAVHYKSDAHLNPNKLMSFLLTKLRERGVEFLENTEIESIDKKQGRIHSLQTKNGAIDADQFIIAAGSWSSKLAKMLGEVLLLLPGKGYSFTKASVANQPKIPTILCEGKVAVTPMGDSIRFGGTMEITDVRDNFINMKRVEGIVETINAFFPSTNMEVPKESEIWKGFRPCSPTGMPYIGRSKKLSNVVYATGHGMMGLSLAPATGLLSAQLVANEQPEIEVSAFNKF